jgi:cytochrome c oxidase assembly protein subunit 15
MTSAKYHPRLHLFACTTPLVALVTLVAGALVTSKNAGMAFRDWPTSDGQAMLTYPWLADFARDWDKFLEHGHRLAGVLIGMWSIALAGLVGWHEERTWVKLAATGVLLGVIAQGVLGGNRVWFDDRGLAMLHGLFAAVVFSGMACTATVLSRRWLTAPEDYTGTRLNAVRPAAITVMALLWLQYFLGGHVRHHGTGLHEHLGLGVLAFLAVAVNTLIAQRSGVAWLRRSAWVLQGIVLAQVALGLSAWVFKWGFAPTGYVAVQDSIEQVASRTAHMVVGALTMSAASVHLLRVSRVARVAPRVEAPVLTFNTPVAAGGGAA